MGSGRKSVDPCRRCGKDSYSCNKFICLGFEQMGRSEERRTSLVLSQNRVIKSKRKMDSGEEPLRLIIDKKVMVVRGLYNRNGL